MALTAASTGYSVTSTHRGHEVWVYPTAAGLAIHVDGERIGTRRGITTRAALAQGRLAVDLVLADA
jgi:hypothetical protein